MKNKLTLTVFALVIALALVGGSWQTTVYAQTVPPEVPALLPLQPVIPVTGGECGFDIVKEDLPIVVDVPASAHTGAAANVLKTGDKVSICVVAPEDLPEYKTINVVGVGYITTVTENGVDLKPEELGNTQEVTIILTTAMLDQFKKNPEMGMLWYDPTAMKWVRIPAEVTENGRLVAKTASVGYFTFGNLLQN